MWQPRNPQIYHTPASMAATVAHATLPHNGMGAPSHPHDVSAALNAGSGRKGGDNDPSSSDGDNSPLPPTRSFKLNEFKLVRTLGTGEFDLSPPTVALEHDI